MTRTLDQIAAAHPVRIAELDPNGTLWPLTTRRARWFGEQVGMHLLLGPETPVPRDVTVVASIDGLRRLTPPDVVVPADVLDVASDLARFWVVDDDELIATLDAVDADPTPQMRTLASALAHRTRPDRLYRLIWHGQAAGRSPWRKMYLFRQTNDPERHLQLASQLPTWARTMLWRTEPLAMTRIAWQLPAAM